MAKNILIVPAIILAAGSGSRMGRTKQLLRINGNSLVRRAAQAALDAKCDPVIVVTGSNSDAIIKELSELSVQIQFNPDWAAGIGTSIRAGLSAAVKSNPAITVVLITLCDQPHLTSKILADLIIAHCATGKPMTACQYSETVGPPCCFASPMFEELFQLNDTAGAKQLLLAQPEHLTTIPWPGGAVDLDTPEDWGTFSELG